MNNLVNIALMQSSGVATTPKTPAAAAAPQDLLGFLTQLVQQLQTAPTTDAATAPATPAQISAPQINDLAAKIAELLQNNGTLPASLQSITPEELTAKIAALLQKTATSGAANSVKPALISDLVAGLSAQIQEEHSKPQLPPGQLRALAHKIADILDDQPATLAPETSPQAPATPESLATLLNDIQPGSGDSSQMAQALAQVQDQPEETPDSSILEQLKDKIAALQMTPGEINRDVLVKFKADVMASLQQQGMDRPTIQNYLSALAKYLRQEDTAAPEAAVLPDAATTPVTAEASAVADDPAAPPAETATPAPAPVTGTAAAPAHKALLQNPAAASANSNTDSPFSQTASADKKEAALSSPAARPETPAPAADTAAPATPRPTLSGKISGLSVNPHLISALAGNDGGFGSGGFGSNNPQSQDWTGNAAGLMKPASVDTVNNQNFMNYMAEGRSAPSPALQMVNVQLQRNISAKVDTMTLQLTPADLGRLDIKLKFAKDGSIRAHLTAEKPETLALLQKDSHLLEKTLQQSGFNVDENALSFDLRHHQGQQHNLEGYNNGKNGNAEEFSGHLNGTAADNTLQARIAIQSHGYITQNGVNIMV